MKSVVEAFVKNPVYANVFMISLFVFGAISAYNMRSSFFPEIEPETLTISVAYPGASPEEIEEGVVLKIEENLEGLDGVQRVTSISRENSATVTVEAYSGYDMEKLTADVKNVVDGINSFPRDIEKPVISQRKFRTRTLTVVLFGDTDLYNLKFIADKFRQELLDDDEISQVEISGVPSLEFSIEVKENVLRKYNITFNEVASAVASANINISGGKIETAAEEILIRAYGRKYLATELADVPIRGNEDGTILYLKDLATFTEKFEDDPSRIYYNGKPAATLSLDQTEQENILHVAESAYGLVDKFNAEHIGLTAKVLDDRTIPLTQRIQLLMNNGVIGLILVVITLGIFLNLRLSGWVAVGIPFSFAGMFLIAAYAGITINVISLFGMILVVGILVDDAIVVAENIFAHYEKGRTPYRAAVDGTTEMIVPVTTSVLTTMVAFSPFFFLDGTFGKFIWQMGLVVVSALFFSLVEAFTILPAHLAHSKAIRPEANPSKIRAKLESSIKHFTNNVYGPVLRYAIKYKWITLATPIALIFITVGLFRGGFIGFTFFPFIDGDNLPVNLTIAAGKQEQETEAILKDIEKKAIEVNKEIVAERGNGQDIITGYRLELGSSDVESGSHAGVLNLQLLEGEQRNMDSYLIANRLREKVGEIPQAVNLTYGRTSPFGKPISVSLLGTDLEQLELAKGMLIKELESMPDLKDITDSDQKGRKELNIRLKPLAYSLGLTLSDIAGTVRNGFFGNEVQRIQRSIDEIRVWVRFTDEDRGSLGFIENFMVRTPSGEEYPFSELAEYHIERGLTKINHLNRKREVQISANLASEELDLPPIEAKVKNVIVPKILSQVEGVTVSYEGQARDMQKTVRSISNAFPVAMVLMFILIILVFRSATQAILIFGLIPLGIMAAIWGHFILDMKVTMLSIYGIIALAGIIVNDSIVLVDQVNRNLKDGQLLYNAVYNAGIARLRPILLTTLTTVFGLAPLILETSRQAQFLIPMAVSVASGLLFGTLILLLILPAAIMALNKFRLMFRAFKNGLFGIEEDVTPELVEPAIKETLVEL